MPQPCNVKAKRSLALPCVFKYSNRPSEVIKTEPQASCVLYNIEPRSAGGCGALQIKNSCLKTPTFNCLRPLRTRVHRFYWSVPEIPMWWGQATFVHSNSISEGMSGRQGACNCLLRETCIGKSWFGGSMTKSPLTLLVMPHCVESSYQKRETRIYSAALMGQGGSL